MEDGKRLNISFDNHEVTFYEKEGEYFAECKGVYINYKDYQNWKDNPKEDLLGFNLQNKPCRIRIIRNIVSIGCLKDTKETFNQIVKLIKKEIKNDKSNSK